MKLTQTILNPISYRNQELKDRTIGAGIGQSLLVVVLYFSTAIFHHGLWQLEYTCFFILALNLIRLALATFRIERMNEEQGKKWFLACGTLVILTAVGWSYLIRTILVVYGFNDRTTLLAFLFMSGLASGAGNALSPSPRLAHSFPLILMFWTMVQLYLDGHIWIGAVFTFYLLFVQGQTLAQQATFRKMKEQESQFRALSSSSFEGVAVHSEGIFLEVNDAYCKLFGYTEREMIGMSVRQIMPPFEIERLTNVIASYSEEIYQTQLIRKDGTLFHAEGVGRHCMYRGKLSRVNCIRDISDRVKAEEERRDLVLARERTAIESSRLKSEFLANMSHEIRTPLNGIIGTTDLLIDLSLNEEQKRYAQTIKKSGDSLLTIVNDLLDFSKIEAGKLSLEKMDFSTVLLLEDQVDLLKTKAHEKKLSLMAHVDPTLPKNLVGDPGRISQILLNIIGNAIKFTAQGSVTTWAKKISEDDHQVMVRFSVKDTGLGLTPTQVEKLFQPFHQADGSTARKFGGTGLGLSICKQLVNMMGGTIEVQSALGEGSEFSFILPLEKSKTRHEKVRPQLEGLKVFLRLENHDLREIVSSYLHAWQLDAEVLDQDQLMSDRPFDLLIISEQELKRGFNPSPLKTVLIREFSTEPYYPAAGKPVGSVMMPLKQSELYDQMMVTSRTPFQAPAPRAISHHETRKDMLAHDGPKKRILIAEDNTINQMIAAANLKKLGYASHVVANGNEVLQALSDADYDLILMDCQMPELDGYQTTIKIREGEKLTHKHIPIVALTANAMKQDERQCLDSGMDDYISKPVRLETLAMVLKKWLDSGSNAISKNS